MRGLRPKLSLGRRFRSARSRRRDPFPHLPPHPKSPALPAIAGGKYGTGGSWTPPPA